MVESPDEPSLLDRIRSFSRKAKAHASDNPFGADDKRPALPLTNPNTHSDADVLVGPQTSTVHSNQHTASANATSNHVAENTSSALPPPAPPPPDVEHEEAPSSIEPEEKPNILICFYEACKEVLFSSWLNTLLVFVPVGIAVQAAGVNKTIVFAINAIAIIPLAGLLSHATESVASDLGDTIGALMNITFGNAVELIIFIALTKDEIQIVQASLLGSILANLLLILGMCFLFGGLRFREQVCKVLRIVIKIDKIADLQQYCYTNERMSTQFERHEPTFTDTSSSSSGIDTDGSSGSNTTAKRIKRVLRGRRRRKSSASSKDTPSVPSTLRTPSASTFAHNIEQNDIALADLRPDYPPLPSPVLGGITSGDEADTDGEYDVRSVARRDTTINFRDFENEKGGLGSKSPEAKPKKRSKKGYRRSGNKDEKEINVSEKPASSRPSDGNRPVSPHVEFAQDIQSHPGSSPKRPFNIRGLSVRDVVPAMPAMPKMLSSTVFSTANPTSLTPSGAPITGITPRALHRSNSLPSRLNQVQAARQAQTVPPLQPQPYVLPVNSAHPVDSREAVPPQKYMSRTSAIILLLVSTGLVAVCAEFLVASINYLVDNTNVSEAFVGLIILPIVGNAAEHVTAVTVASKNKMDLAIGVAVGSSIQIALFVTPVIVLLGWILNKDMSLYFSLFETISLFVSAFIVNFLVLDGRSNYLEGALLIAAYVIIALAAFFYPDSDEQSTVGGADAVKKLFRML
ncbi:MAG: hypothetical protein ASARMPRED_009085 [Alectoria sarmentosa]|nr:MAG: hypothetical protein ASARMPRED_009085 [Alectoria sarmentosa]